MKCPVCNKGTVEEFETAPYFACSNEFCPSYSETDTTEYDILIRTRKALDVAKDALNTIKGKHDPRCAVYHIDEKTAYDALEQITALEQGGDNGSNS